MASIAFTLPFTSAFASIINQEANLIDPLRAGNPPPGRSTVALGENVVIVGVPGENAADIYHPSDTTWSRAARLAPSVTGESFGHAIALSGDTLVVGASNGNGHSTGSGVIYIYVRNGTSWQLQSRLHADDGMTGDAFGSAVAIAEDTIIVGSPNHVVSSTKLGAAYVFERESDNWTQRTRLFAEKSSEPDRFGTSVAISGPNIAVGESTFGESGTVHTFRRTASGWAPHATLVPFNAGSVQTLSFGHSIALQRDTLVVGAPSDKEVLPGALATRHNVGAVFVFTLSDDNWLPQARLHPAEPQPDIDMGRSVSLSGGVLAIGSANGVQVFKRNGSTWTPGQKLVPTNLPRPTPFGGSVAAYADRVAVGADSDGGAGYLFHLDTIELPEMAVTGRGVEIADGSDSTSPISGTDFGEVIFDFGVVTRVFTITNQGNGMLNLSRATVVGPGAEDYSILVQPAIRVAPQSFTAFALHFNPSLIGPREAIIRIENNDPSESSYDFVVRGAGIPTPGEILITYLKSGTPRAGGLFGYSVAVDGDTAVIGADQEGTAYVFTRSRAGWTQQAHLTATNADPADQFGHSVAISGDTIIVGAIGEDSSARQINGDGADNAAANAGAAYVFVRSGSTWTQQAYLKAANAGADDRFGRSVSIDRDSLVVGAESESGDASSAAEADNDNASFAGAAYVFIRAGKNWVQQAYLKANDAGANDNFGRAVSISGDRVVVGARGEDGADGTTASAGAAYVFARSGTIWSQEAQLRAPEQDGGDMFGMSVAIDSDTILVGAHGEDGALNQKSSAGAAFVFTRSGTIWSLQSLLRAGNADANDLFGWSVDLDGNTAVVGAVGESSANTDATDNSATHAGAAYLFKRRGSQWNRAGYFKASSADAGDWFGHSVAVDGHLLLAGAHLEDGSSSSLGGNTADNDSQAAGAAYAMYLGHLPSILYIPDRLVSSSSGADESLSVTATNAATFQWYLNEVALPGETNASLSLSGRRRSHSGNYSVTAFGAAGGVESGPIPVSIIVPQHMLAPRFLSSDRLLLQFQDEDQLGLPGDLSKLELQWRSALPSSTTDTWHTVQSTLFQTDGVLGIEDTVSPGEPARFYRILERTP